MKAKAKRKSIGRNPVSESRGQPAEIFRPELEESVNGRARMTVATQKIFLVAV